MSDLKVYQWTEEDEKKLMDLIANETLPIYNSKDERMASPILRSSIPPKHTYPAYRRQPEDKPWRPGDRK